MFAIDDRLAEYERWRDDAQRTVEEASRPLLRVDTATSWAAAAAESGIDSVIAETSGIHLLALPGAGGRPRGPRVGTLVHAVLGTVPLDAADDAVARTAATQGRMLGASAEEVTAAAAVVTAVLRHELMGRVRAATAIRRETPLSWRQDDGTLIEGGLDLAFDEGAVTTVVDFKTDHELAAGEARYRAQLQKYVDAVAAATRRQATGILFRI